MLNYYIFSIINFAFSCKRSQVALENRNTIYFRTIKQNYKWCYFSETLVNAFLSDQDQHTIAFWNTSIKKYELKIEEILVKKTQIPLFF